MISNVKLSEDEINNSLVWNTNNELLLHADEKRNKMNRAVAILEEEIEEKNPSYVTGANIKRRASELRSLCLQIESQNNFENIVKEDIVRNADAASTMASFMFDITPSKFTRSGKHFSVGTYLLNLYGLSPKESPYNIILRMARNHDHNLTHKYFELTHTMRRRSRDVYLKGMLPALEERILPKVKKVLLDVADEFHFPRKDMSIDVFFDQICAGYSYFDGENKLASLDPNEILIYRDDNHKEHLFEGNIMLEGVHERIHSLHSGLSELSLPQFKGLITKEESYNSLHIPLSEGIARRSERLSLLFFFEKNKESLGLTEKDLEIMDYSSKYDLSRRSYQTLFSILKVMDATESQYSFDPYKKLAQITRIPGLLRDPYMMDDIPLSLNLYSVSSLIGSQYIKRCLQEVNEIYGREQVDENLGLISRGFMTGHWQIPIHYKFLKQEYIPRLEKMGILIPKDLDQRAVS